MAESIVREWIAEYKTLRSAEIHSFGCTISQNNELIQAVFTILEEKKYHEEFLETVCHNFFSFYRCREETLQNFARQYIPCLIGLYLSSVAKGNKNEVRSVEVFLLGIYNLEVIDSLGKSSSVSFRVPLLSKPSIYHETMNLSHSVLSEKALSTLEYGDNRTISLGTCKEIEKLNASNRLLVMTVLMRIYNQYIGSMPTFSHMSVCKMCSKVIKQGYNRSNSGYNNPHPRPIARITLNPPLMLEMIHAVYFATFNDLGSLGIQTLDELHNRALQEMMSEVLLVTNAIRNSMRASQSGQPSDGAMGLALALSPTTVVSTVTRAITNASFRAKKLPDDIPIQETETEAHQLSSINEEAEDTEPTSAKAGKKSSSITKTVVLQLRKNKKKDRDAPEVVDAPKTNGKVHEAADEVPKSADTKRTRIPDMKTPEEFEFDNVVNNADAKRSSFPCRTSESDGFDFDGVMNNAKYVNHTSPMSDVVITSDGGCVLKSVLHRSESSNGVGSSMQTAV